MEVRIRRRMARWAAWWLDLRARPTSGWAVSVPLQRGCGLARRAWRDTVCAAWIRYHSPIRRCRPFRRRHPQSGDPHGRQSEYPESRRSAAGCRRSPWRCRGRHPQGKPSRP